MIYLVDDVDDLVLTNIAMENHHFIIGKPSINGPFSMAMLNNQREMIWDIPNFQRKRQNRYCNYTNYTLMMFIDFLMESQ